MSATTEKRCYYEVLGLPQTCTQDEIRSAYKKLALQRHPDKLIQSGTPADSATALFQELVHAYEVLSDPKERSWYDSHRSQILFSSAAHGGTDDPTFPDIFSYFSPSCYTDFTDPETGFYKVYGDVFNRVYMSEVRYCHTMGVGSAVVKEAPVMGDLKSEYGQVSAFYGYWLGFNTVMDFGWVDKWDVAGGVDRRSRRAMEAMNEKLRRKAKREFNETVRGLAEFVKKRDKRVVEEVKRKEKERERKREEEVRRREEREREKKERAKAFEVPEWARVEEEVEEEEEEEEDEERVEFYCPACGKKFKSDKQWRNHERSKKHRDRVEKLKREMAIEDDEFEEVEDNVVGNVEVEVEVEGDDDVVVDVLKERFRESVGVGEEQGSRHVDFEEGDKDELKESNVPGPSSANGDEVDSDEEDDLNEKFEDSVEFEVGKDGDDQVHLGVEDGVGEVEKGSGVEQSVDGSDEEEVTILEPMASGRRRGKHVSIKNQSLGKNHAESDDETEAMEYSNKKGKKKSRRAKKDKGKGVGAESTSAGFGDAGEESSVPGSNTADTGDDDDGKSSMKGGKRAADRKSTSKRDSETKPNSLSKGRKQKEKSKGDPVCEKCGEEFDSRNQLYKHISDTGHASLKFK